MPVSIHLLHCFRALHTTHKAVTTMLLTSVVRGTVDSAYALPDFSVYGAALLFFVVSEDLGDSITMTE
jgi:hypothetical protein